ncbi:Trk K+ transport system NAD-binding subunit [Catenulispora sp. GAS73]|uniref:NAD-binding protein n=1 Tax=Catenulispora sp. GAS73 TaxID=3156269 RepID=UPI0035136093
MGDLFIVVGGNALAYRLTVELTRQYAVRTAAIVPSQETPYTIQIGKALGPENTIADAYVSEEALREAGIDQAQAIAFVDGDDRTNIHAAMRAAALRPGIRIVIRMFNQRLGVHIAQLVDNCTVLSASATAAPAFVNAALQRPHSVSAGGRALRIAIGQDIDMRQTPFLIADAIDRDRQSDIEVLPTAAARSRTREWMLLQERSPRHAALQFLDVSDTIVQGNVYKAPLAARLLWRGSDTLKFFTSAKLRTILMASVATLAVSFVGIWLLARPFGWALYESLLDVAGSAVPDTYGQPSSVGGNLQRLFQVAITLSGIVLMPVVTAVFVESTATRRNVRIRQPSTGLRGHVVVVGLGNAGTRVTALFRELGVPVVGIERDADARGLAAARGLDVPAVIGDRPIDDALRRAQIARARAVVAVTGDDVTNLEAALEARAINPEVRVVVRLFDDDFASHVYKEFGNTASRSVSYLAAPAFAAAMMGREVLGTLSVYRKVLLIAEVAVEEGSELAGQEQRDLDKPGLTRVLAVRRTGSTAFDWSGADRGRVLQAGDRLIVAATRAGFGGLAGRIGEGNTETDPVSGD